MRMNQYILLFIVLLVSFLSCNKNDDAIVPDEMEYQVNWTEAADSSSTNFIYSYWNSTRNHFNYNNNGLTDFHYWPQAHALDVLVDAYVRSNDNLYKSKIDSWYWGVRRFNGSTFINEFYDDMEWNALAMLRTFNSVGDERFKHAVLDLWADIKGGWNNQAEGGIAWKKDQPYSKNAVSNAPASILSSRLYQQFGDVKDKEWAEKLYNWEKETLFDTTTGAIYDHVDARTGLVKKDWIFTYNQGTFIGAAVELYNITGEKNYLNDAKKAADYALKNLIVENDQLLKNEGAGDGGLFKGIFIRYFTLLILHPDIENDTRERYVAFLKNNAETLWKEGTNKSNLLYGTYWKTKPGSTVDLPTQISGAMLIEAMAMVERNKLLE